MPDDQTPGYEVVAGIGHKGSGLFATRGFERNDPLYEFDYWSRSAMPMHSTNHSCDPNAGFDRDGMLRALRTIATHEEIRYDYLLYPIPASAWNFRCECGSRDCKGWIDARGSLEGVESLKEDAEQTHAAEAANRGSNEFQYSARPR